MRLAWPVLAAGFAACASTAEKGDRYLESWRGAREVELLRAWGEPSKAIRSSGRSVLVYETATQVDLPGAQATFGARGPVGGSPSMTVVMWCTTTFELEESVVTQAAAAGNGCGHRRMSGFRR